MREIKPINHNGSIQLKFSVSGKRYSFNPIPGAEFNKPRDIARANAIATKISNDILAGYFDPTLERYRTLPKASTKSDSSATKPTLLVNLWDIASAIRMRSTTLYGFMTAFLRISSLDDLIYRQQKKH